MSNKYDVVLVELEYRNELLISRNGEVLERYTDNGEPEDNSFFRDYRWIKSALEQAYEIGFRDGSVAADLTPTVVKTTSSGIPKNDKYKPINDLYDQYTAGTRYAVTSKQEMKKCNS